MWMAFSWMCTQEEVITQGSHAIAMNLWEIKSMRDFGGIFSAYIIDKGRWIGSEWKVEEGKRRVGGEEIKR